MHVSVNVLYEFRAWTNESGFSTCNVIVRVVLFPSGSRPMQRCSFLLDRTANLRTRGISLRLLFMAAVRVLVWSLDSCSHEKFFANFAPIRFYSDGPNLVRSLFNHVWFVCFHLYYLHVCISLYTCANVMCIKLLFTYLLCVPVNWLDTSSLSRSKPRP